MTKEVTPGRPTTRRYTKDEKDQAVRLVFALRRELGTTRGTVVRVADQLGYGTESVRRWVVDAEIEAGDAPGMSGAERVKMKKLEQDKRELRRANEILKRASAFFCGGARPPTEIMVRFVDASRGEFGVESICRTLQVAPSTYYDYKKRPLSARAIRDAVVMPVLLALFEANYSVYGVRKLWIAAKRDGYDIGRDQVGRLMKRLGIQGVSRRRRVRTTRPDDQAVRPHDLVEGDFTADAPNRLWVTDLTYVPTWRGVGYVCFIIDAFSRRIVGWRVAANMRTSMVLDALEMALGERHPP